MASSFKGLNCLPRMSSDELLFLEEKGRLRQFSPRQDWLMGLMLVPLVPEGVEWGRGRTGGHRGPPAATPGVTSLQVISF